MIKSLNKSLNFKDLKEWRKMKKILMIGYLVKQKADLDK
jgi:hypothetical protein